MRACASQCRPRPRRCGRRFSRTSRQAFALSYLNLVLAALLFGPSQAIGAEPVTLGQVAQNWSNTGEARQTSVVVNKSRVLRVSEAFAETLIANDKIADIVPITD
ncbi:MAG: pilus assembly protein N-terminal domain-containing protein, partial [Hyphomicrobiaceae bacterium]